MDKNDFFIENSLPNSLTDEEFYNYFLKFKNGDMTSRDIIIYHNIRLVLSRVMNIFKYVNCEKRDLVAIGLIGLIKALNIYDITKKYKFSTLAARCIDHEIIMFFRKEKRWLNLESLDKKITNSKGDKEITLGDLIEVSSDSFFDKVHIEERNLLIRQVIDDLNDRERKIVILYFGFDGNKCHTQAEIAKIIGISQVQISRVLKKSLNDLKNIFTEKEIIQCISTK